MLYYIYFTSLVVLCELFERSPNVRIYRGIAVTKQTVLQVTIWKVGDQELSLKASIYVEILDKAPS